MSATLEGGRQINNKNVLFYFDSANVRSYDGVSNTGYSLVLGTPATLLTGVTWSSSSYGTMRFNGTWSAPSGTHVIDSWISCGSRIPELGVASSLTFPFTMEAWIKPKNLNGGNSAGNTYGILSLDSMEQYPGVYYGLDLSLSDNNGTDTHDLQISYYNPVASPGYGSQNRRSGITTGRPVICGQWSHVVGVVSAPGTFNLYVNGEAVSNTITGTYLGSTITWSGGQGRTVIGKPAGFYKYIFNGDIATVIAYNSALTAGDIKKNYNLHALRFGLTTK